MQQWDKHKQPLIDTEVREQIQNKRNIFLQLHTTFHPLLTIVVAIAVNRRWHQVDVVLHVTTYMATAH